MKTPVLYHFCARKTKAKSDFSQNNAAIFLVFPFPYIIRLSIRKSYKPPKLYQKRPQCGTIPHRNLHPWGLSPRDCTPTGRRPTRTTSEKPLRTRRSPHATSSSRRERGARRGGVAFGDCPRRNQTRSNILLRHLDRIESALAALHVETRRPRLTIADCLVAIAHGIQLRPFAQDVGEARLRR